MIKNFIRSTLNHFPQTKKNLQKLLRSGNAVSSHYTPVEQSEINAVSQNLRSSWQDSALPERQRSLVEQQLSDFAAGKPIDVFDAFINPIKKHIKESGPASLLEIGCSSGYYSKVIDIAGLPVSYHGCDYSPAFIKLAKSCHPGIPFDVEDAVKLSYADASFDIVVSGCCLLHIPEYSEAISETARIARDSVIFHRTPVILNAETQYYTKQAYGVETIEIHIAEDELYAHFKTHNLELIDTIILSETPHPTLKGAVNATKTYACRKVPA